MTDLDHLEELLAKATWGDWAVSLREIPWSLENGKSGTHTERTIHTLKDHSQLRGTADYIDALEARVDSLMTSVIATGDEKDAALKRAEAAERALAEAVEVLRTSREAMAEYIRYLDGGEMRGSYDGKPERNGLRKAEATARAFIAKMGEK